MSTVWSGLGLDDPKQTCDRVLTANPATLHDRIGLYKSANQKLGTVAHGIQEAIDKLDDWRGDGADAARNYLNHELEQRKEQAQQCQTASDSYQRTLAAFLEAQRRLQEIRHKAEEIDGIFHAVCNALEPFIDGAGRIIHGVEEKAHGFLGFVEHIPVVGSVVKGIEHIVERVSEGVVSAVQKIPGSSQVSSFVNSLSHSQNKLQSLMDFIEPLRPDAVALNMTANDVLEKYEKVLREESGHLTDLHGVVDKGAGPNDRPGDADLRRGALFYSVYGHYPQTPEDRLMAAALDPNGSDATDTDPESHIVVVHIKPVPGAGVVYGDAFIPQDDVMNPLSGTDGLNPIPFNLGDNRSFDPNAAPDKSRMSWYIDYERGVVVVRQNVTHDEKGTAASGNPHVGVEQSADGSVRMRVEGSDALANPAGEAIHGTVKADVVVDPHGGQGKASVNGRVSQYPSFEMYQMRNGQVEYPPLLNQKADTRPLGTPESWGLGPMVGLSMYGNVNVNDPSVLQQWYDHYHPAQAQPNPNGGIVLAPDQQFQQHSLPDAPYPTFENGHLNVPEATQVR
ncbi:MAG: hypothetical protein ACRC20_08520 [Segniliparus sp.]|uniref:hypothetical protein n=1 Tax=Segniliparus sp. TaxID=2804064 RepID=UPI003F3BB9D1